MISTPKTAHTPGPWRTGKRAFCVVSDSPTVVDQLLGADDVGYYGGHLIAESVAKCNIPLISAAPELLEALKGVIGLGHEEDCEGFEFCKVCAVLAAAKALRPKAVPHEPSIRPRRTRYRRHPSRLRCPLC